MIEIIEPNFIHEDERGKLVQLVRDNFKQFNIIFSEHDVIRGNHYHKLNREAFYVISGKFELIAEYENQTQKYIFKDGDMFIIPPLVTHSFKYLEKTLLASMYDIGVELPNGSKDIYTP